MDIERAQALELGGTVHCPSDRGDAAYAGTVDHIDPTVRRATLCQQDFLWVTVRHPKGSKHVWPSNRLGAQ